jgi:hypothetical protein
MSLTNLSQIKGLKDLRGEVDLLLKSYDAAKVVTQIAKAEGEGNYNVDELLASLKVKLDAITGEAGEAQSLEALKTAIDGLKNKTIKAYTGNAEEPVKEYKLSELPEDALLKSEELDITAYQNALDALVAKLAANKELINAVKELIGDKSVQASIEEAVAEVNAALALKGDKAVVEKADADLKILDTKIEDLENSTVVEVQDVIKLGEVQVDLPLSAEADTQEVRLYVNGAVYYENDDFTVDRKGKKLTWTLADFNLTSAIAAKVTAKYYTAADLGGFDPTLIQIDDSKIVLTREEPEKSFNVTIPADCTLEVVPSDPEAVEITVTEV